MCVADAWCPGKVHCTGYRTSLLDRSVARQDHFSMHTIFVQRAVVVYPRLGTNLITMWGWTLVPSIHKMISILGAGGSSLRGWLTIQTFYFGQAQHWCIKRRPKANSLFASVPCDDYEVTGAIALTKACRHEANTRDDSLLLDSRTMILPICI